jgi:hypothetical protein
MSDNDRCPIVWRTYLKYLFQSFMDYGRFQSQVGFVHSTFRSRLGTGSGTGGTFPFVRSGFRSQVDFVHDTFSSHSGIDSSGIECVGSVTRGMGQGALPKRGL